MYKELTFLLCFLCLSPYLSLPHQVPELTPPNNQTEPNNLGDNVTYICTIPMIPNLELLWEVDNRQITPDIIEAFEDRGIFIMSGSSDNESTIIFTQEVYNYTCDTVKLYNYVHVRILIMRTSAD